MAPTEETLGSGWDYDPPTPGGNFLKLEDGESAKVVFTGQPEFFRKDWGENSQYERFQDRGKIQLFNLDADSRQVWEAHPMHFKALKTEKRICEQERKLDFAKCVFIMTRSGTKSQTRYSFSFLRELDAAPTSSGGAAVDDDEDIPF